MKRFLAIFFAVCLVGSFLAGCSKEGSDAGDIKSKKMDAAADPEG